MKSRSFVIATGLAIFAAVIGTAQLLLSDSAGVCSVKMYVPYNLTVANFPIILIVLLRVLEIMFENRRNRWVDIKWANCHVHIHGDGPDIAGAMIAHDKLTEKRDTGQPLFE